MDVVHDEKTLIVECENDSVVTQKPKENSILWHRRFGHTSFDYMDFLKSELKNMTIPKNSVCETCIKGKHSRKPFSDKGNRAKQLLELVHTDLCGPLQVKSFKGNRFILTFIDDFSHKKKSDVYKCFIDFKTMVENQSGNKLKVLRSDNGTEYFSNAFKRYCEHNGILQQKTAVYTPQQNGVAERINRTILEKVRCMLIDSGVAKEFWAEAVMTAAYIINRVPCKGSGDKSPEEIWSGQKPNMKWLKVFGCKAYAQVPAVKRKKLDDKSTECIFVGYSSDSKTYRLYDVREKMIITSRDVIFIESSVQSKVTDCEIDKINQFFLQYSEGEEEKSDSCESEEEEQQLNGADLTLNDSQTVRADGSSNGIANDSHNVSSSSSSSSDSNGSIIPVAASTPRTSDNESDDDDDDSIRTVVAANRSSNETDVDDDDESEWVPDDPIDKRVLNEDADQTPVVRSSARNANKPKPNYATFAYAFMSCDPSTFKQAVRSESVDLWKGAMKEEFDSLQANRTWQLVELPPGKTPIKCKWVYKTKRDTHGKVIRHKARLVAKGYTQVEGVDYHETFSPVVRFSTIRYLMAIAAKFDLNIRQFDVVTAFLHGTLDEEIYMTQPEGFSDNSNRVCKLIKSIYGLKQSSRVWNTTLNKVLLDFGLKRSSTDQCVYYSIEGKRIFIVAIYVDDIIVFSNNKEMEERLAKVLFDEFKMKDMGEISSVLGIRVTRNRKSGIISLDQTNYIKDLLSRFKMDKCNDVTSPMDANQKLTKKMCPSTEEETKEMLNVPYRELVGALQFCVQVSRPDICFAVNVLSRYNNNPGKAH